MTKPSEEYWKILNSINEWIRFSDIKAGAILSIYGVLLTVIYSNSKQVFELLNSNNCILILAIIATLSSIASVIFSFLTLNPTLKNKNPHSILFFGHVQEKFDEFENYNEHAVQVIQDKDRYRNQLAEQVFTNSKISWRKFKFISWSIRFFMATISVLILTVAIYLINML
jgi:hypothetical protein